MNVFSWNFFNFILKISGPFDIVGVIEARKSCASFVVSLRFKQSCSFSVFGTIMFVKFKIRLGASIGSVDWGNSNVGFITCTILKVCDCLLFHGVNGLISTTMILGTTVVGVVITVNIRLSKTLHVVWPTAVWLLFMPWIFRKSQPI